MAIKASNEFTNILHTIVVITGYGIAFYFLSLVLKIIPVGIAYAIWDGVGVGVGIVLMTLSGAVIFRQIPDIPAIIGMLLIVSGVVVINVFSKTACH